MFKRRKLKIGDLIDESFEGSCVLRAYQMYVGTSKTITLSIEEIMASELNTELNTKRSYFDEYYEETVSDEASLEEAK